MSNFRHEFEVPVCHTQVDVSGGQLDVSLKLRQDATIIHLGVISKTGLWHLGTERQGHLFTCFGAASSNLSSHSAHIFLGHRDMVACFLSNFLRTLTKLNIPSPAIRFPCPEN